MDSVTIYVRLVFTVRLETKTKTPQPSVTSEGGDGDRVNNFRNKHIHEL